MLGQLTELCENYAGRRWLDVFEPSPLRTAFARMPGEVPGADRGDSLVDTEGNRWYQDCHTDVLREINTLVKRINPDCVIVRTPDQAPEYDGIDDFFTRELLRPGHFPVLPLHASLGTVRNHFQAIHVCP